jgi:hypothetical protein
MNLPVHVRRHQQQYLIVLLLMSLSLLLGGTVVLSVGAAKLCHTKDNALVAPTLAGFKEAVSIIRSGDVKAYDQLLEQKRVMRLPAEIPVFIEDSLEEYHRIRPKGMIKSVWTSGYYLICPKEPRRRK